MAQRPARFAILLSLAALLLLAADMHFSAAQAQPRDPLGNFFRSLFGTREAPMPRQPYQPAPSPPPPTRAAPAEPKVAAVPKDEDARVIRVFGDSLSAGLQRGLDEAFAEVPSIVVAGMDRATSGLVRYDRFDWFDAASEAIGAEGARTDAAVLMIGLNDRQDMPTGEGRLALLSEEWVQAYKERISALTGLFVERGIRVYWVGLPPMNNGQLTRDFAIFNEFYKDVAMTSGAVFVDVWTPFLDQETGRYSAYGPDIEGTRRQLRASDGMHFTRAGNRKLAFFVERDIRRDFLRGLYLSAVEGPRGQSLMDQVEQELETGIGRIVALTGRQILPEGLAGGSQEEPRLREDTRYKKVILEGEPLPMQPGRADDFRWAAGPAAALPERVPAADAAARAVPGPQAAATADGWQ